jgi:N-acetylmuramic acid 6-phosphate etherase
MGAATAQKAALNMISTLMGIKLGQVYDGRMIGVVADNIKLRSRAATMVADIAGAGHSAAADALAAAKGAVKPAVLIALGLSEQEAAAMLVTTEGNLRAAIARVRTPG